MDPVADALRLFVVDHHSGNARCRDNAFDGFRAAELLAGGGERGFRVLQQFGVRFESAFAFGVQRKRSIHELRDVRMLHRFDVAKDPGDRVVVFRWNGIELVVVAAGAGHRLRQKSFGHDVDLFVDDVHPQLLFVLFLEVGVAEHQERRRRRQTLFLPPTVARKKVAGDLLANHAVEWNVIIEGIDHVVAIAPTLFEQKPAKRQ